MTRKRKALWIARPKHETESFGGPETMRLMVGSRIALAPHCDLWIRGAKFAEVRDWRETLSGFAIKVRPEVAGQPLRGKLHTILPHHVATVL